MKEIPLTQGKVALVDDDDYEALLQFKWFAKNHPARGIFYAVRAIAREDGSKRQLYMHRVVCPVDDGFTVDHKNGNGLDNRKINLRPASRAQQKQNAAKKKCLKFPYKGVNKRRDDRYEAYIRVDGRAVYLGAYRTAEQAHNAYADAAYIYFGDFARPESNADEYHSQVG